MENNNNSTTEAAVSEKTPRHPMHSLLMVVAALSIFGAVIFFLYGPLSYDFFGNDDTSTEENQVIESELEPSRSITQMREENVDYQRANDLLDQNRFEESKTAFTEFLESDLNFTTAQESQVKFKIAVATRRTDGDVAAVPLFKEIALNETYPIRNRGNAVEYLGRMHANQPTPELYDAIFSGPAPFSTFEAAAEAEMAQYGRDFPRPIQKLYEFASSLYPTAEGEFRLASIYADDLEIVQARIDAGESVADGVPEGLLDSINEKLDSGRADMGRLQEADFYDLRYERGLLGLAIVLGKLELLGIETDQSADEAYQDALTAFAVRGPVVGQFVNYNYALFLAERGAEGDRERGLELLSQFYEPGASGTYRGVYDFIREKESIYELGLAGDLMTLAEFDPEFRNLMTILGWQRSDFQAFGL